MFWFEDEFFYTFVFLVKFLNFETIYYFELFFG